jgi:hypothetical protein
MTVCIASYCYTERCFVCAVDQMLSTGDMSSESGAMKFSGLGSRWACMFACNDIAPIKPMIREVRAALYDPDIVETREEVVAAFKNAYDNQKKRKIEATVLPHGMNLDEFYEKGLERLGADTFTRILAQIQSVQLDISFLVCGFSGSEPCLFTICDPGCECDYDILGFYAIGSGSNNALGSLFNLKGTPLNYRPLAEIVYRVCEAKFYAESAQGVGKTTTAFIVSETDRYILQDLEPLHAVWDANSLRPVPIASGPIVQNSLTVSPQKAKESRVQQIEAQTGGATPSDSQT